MQYDFSFASGGQGQQFEVVGRFVKYASGIGPVRLRLTNGEYVDLMPGQGVYGVPFSGFNVTDRSGQANRGVILAGDFDFRDERITGNVSVVDNSRDEVLAGSSFVANRGGFAPAAGKFGITQLYNGATGKRIAINSLTITSNVSGGIYLSGGSVGLPATYVQPCWNKCVGLPDSLAKTNFAETAVAVGSPELGGAVAYGRITVSAGVPYLLKFVRPIVLRENQAFNFTNETAQASTAFLIDFDEF